MQITYPHYYQRFACAADQCPDTCCAGWQIVIDEETREKYSQVKGEMGERLNASICQDSFRQKKGRCVFLNEKGLCDIYTQLGSKMLCRTCKNYPRHMEEFENLREMSLSMSCPAAAEILLGCREKVRFVTMEEETEEESYEEFDFFLFDKLMSVREILFKLLQDRRQPAEYRMAACVGLVHDVQLRINKRQLAEVDMLLERYSRAGAWEKLKKRWSCYEEKSDEKFYMLRKMMECLEELEVLNPRFIKQVKGYQQMLFFRGREHYQREREEFEQYCREQKLALPKEQWMVYFVYTYFAGAVYDEDAYAKLKMAAVSTVFLSEWAFAQWMRNGKLLRQSDLVEISYRYSRELEHSDFNLNKLEELMSKRSLFSLEQLMTVILN